MGILSRIRILKRIIEIAYTMFIVILLSVIVGLILAFPVMWLWNFVFGSMLHINVFQAWALNILSGILFGKGSDTSHN
ncbi:MAG: hypothetical protein QF824_05750 [Candidatus Woesearchaeota archaeon]|jgi:hypothetical protein|nr:hypothetical protein [Candidatus Woesearchaeota archaeon]